MPEVPLRTAVLDIAHLEHIRMRKMESLQMQLSLGHCPSRSKHRNRPVQPSLGPVLVSTGTRCQSGAQLPYKTSYRTVYFQDKELRLKGCLLRRLERVSIHSNHEEEDL